MVDLIPILKSHTKVWGTPYYTRYHPSRRPH